MEDTRLEISNVIFSSFSNQYNFFVIRNVGVVVLDENIVEIWEIKRILNRCSNKLQRMC